MSEQKQLTFKVEDIFEDIPDDPENVTMTIPEEIQKAAGIHPGDTVKILWGDQGTIIIEKVDLEKKEPNVEE
jgi:hypothetical protein